MSSTIAPAKAKSLTAQEAYEISKEAFVYFYPLVTMDVTRSQLVNLEANTKPGFGPANTFSHIREYPTADFKTVVRPNFDTLYSSACVDLTNEPMILSLPSTNGRYYLMPMLDMWTDVFASPGWRTTGTDEQHYAILPPNWKGTLPEGIETIQAPTPYIWLIGRTKTDGPDDYAGVHKIQDGYQLTPLSQWGKTPTVPQVKVDSTVDMKTPPLDQVNNMPAGKYFARAAGLMKLHAPHTTDWSALARIKRLGIVPGKSFQFDQLDADTKAAVERGAKDAVQLIKEKVSIMGRPANGWQMNTNTMGVYGDYYLKRAVVAMVGLGANQCEDAIYPLCATDADGKPLNGNNNYVLHFDKDALPPVWGFWSVTMYDKEGFQAANSLNRFAISSWMPLKHNADGSLDLYLQNANPGPDKEANWLPAPKTELGVTMRLYAPKDSALNDEWNPPAIKLLK